MIFNRRSRSILTITHIFILFTSLLANGCGNQIRVYGVLPKKVDIEAIKAGSYKREQVRSLLGTPSTTANFGEDTWYYVGARVKPGVFSSDLLERKVVAVGEFKYCRSSRTFEPVREQAA